MEFAPSLDDLEDLFLNPICRPVRLVLHLLKARRIDVQNFNFEEELIGMDREGIVQFPSGLREGTDGVKNTMHAVSIGHDSLYHKRLRRATDSIW